MFGVLIQLLIFVLVMVIILWLVKTYVPEPPQKIITILVVIIAILWLVSGFFGGLAWGPHYYVR